jgi:hypothetical protein
MTLRRISGQRCWEPLPNTSHPTGRNRVRRAEFDARATAIRATGSKVGTEGASRYEAEMEETRVLPDVEEL